MKLSKLWFVITIAVNLLASHSHAYDFSHSDIETLRDHLPGLIVDYYAFTSPNEANVHDLKKLLTKARPSNGAYLGVGTERVIMGGYLSRASGLIAVDRSFDVLVFHFINILLLEASNSMGDYRDLRIDADLKVWKKRLNIPGWALNETETLFSWWEINVRSSHDFHAAKSMEPPEELVPFTHHKGLNEFAYFQYPERFEANSKQLYSVANYLFDEDAYTWVKDIVNRGKFQFKQSDLKNEACVEQLASALKDYGEKILVVDLSNAWMDFYIGFKRTAKFLVKIRESLARNSQLVITGGLGVYKNDLIVHAPKTNEQLLLREWTYSALRLPGDTASDRDVKTCLLKFMNGLERNQSNDALADKFEKEGRTLGPYSCEDLKTDSLFKKE